MSLRCTPVGCVPLHLMLATLPPPSGGECHQSRSPARELRGMRRCTHRGSASRVSVLHVGCLTTRAHPMAAITPERHPTLSYVALCCELATSAAAAGAHRAPRRFAC